MIDSTLDVFSIDGVHTIAGKASDYIKSYEKNTKIGIFINGDIKEYIAKLRNGDTISVKW